MMSSFFNLFIIGSNGYIGSQLSLNAKNKNISVYGTSTTGANNTLYLNLESPTEFDYSIIKPSDTVLLTAAISSPDICAKEHDRAWAVNVTGTSKFITNVIAKGGRVIFFSSDTVYGERDDEFDEKAECNPAGEYAEMKHEVEKRFLDNPLFKTIRLSYVFSNEDKFTKYLSRCNEKGEEAEIFHPFYRAIVHRNDIVEGVIALAKHWDEFPQNIINFGGPNILSRTEFAEILRDTALPNLRFRVIEPDDNFFKNRPKIIRMTSQALPLLLGRCPLTLQDAIKIEFNIL